jgi:hypothetical protein
LAAITIQMLTNRLAATADRPPATDFDLYTAIYIYIYIYIYITEVLDAGPSYLTNPPIRDRPLWSVPGIPQSP